MTDTEITRILVLVQDPLLRLGLAATLGEQAGFSVWSDMRATTSPDVVVADYEHGMALAMHDKAADGAHARGRAGEQPRILIVTPRDSEWEIRQALEAGVRGYLIVGCKLSEVVDGVRFVKLGMRHVCAAASRRLADSVACVALTGRETEVMRLVAQGRGNKFVARELDIAIGTVKSHLKAIFEKLGARNRTEVATVAKSRGLLDPPISARSAPYGRGAQGNTWQSPASSIH